MVKLISREIKILTKNLKIKFGNAHTMVPDKRGNTLFTRTIKANAMSQLTSFSQVKVGMTVYHPCHGKGKVMHVSAMLCDVRFKDDRIFFFQYAATFSISHIYTCQIITIQMSGYEALNKSTTKTLTMKKAKEDEYGTEHYRQVAYKLQSTMDNDKWLNADRDLKFVVEVIQRLNKGERDAAQKEYAMQMLMDWEAELKSIVNKWP